MFNSFTAGINDFTFNLFRQLSDKGACSPKNIADTLAILYPAAQGETAAAMRKVLNFPESGIDVLTKIGKANNALADDKQATIRTANAVWAQQSYPFKLDYIRVVKEVCGAEFGTVDYSDEKNHPEISDSINAWVARRTTPPEDGAEPLIKELVTPKDFTKETVISMVSAICSSTKFKEKFNVGLTRKQPFFLADGKQSVCQMMTRQSDYRVVATDDLEMCEFPYAGDTVLSVILPKNDMAKVEASLSDTMFRSLSSQVSSGDTVVMLPKFKIETKIDLQDALCKMGMEVAFSDDADFSHMIEDDSYEKSRGVKIGKALHKAVVDTTEEGTEAAAATFVTGVMRMTAAPRPVMPRKFIANRPFVYVIWSRPTGGILFVGRHDKPSGY